MNDQPKVPQSSPPPKSSVSSEVGSFAGTVHEYINQNIQFADQKAAFLFAAVAAMLAFLHQKGITTLWMQNPAYWDTGDILAFVAVVGLVAGATAAMWVVRPRIGGNPEGLVFWKSIARYESAKAYADQVLKPESDLTADMLQHCHELAKNCSRKYYIVDVAAGCGGIGLLASIFYLALF